MGSKQVRGLHEMQNKANSHKWNFKSRNNRAQPFMGLHLHETAHGFACPGIKLQLVPLDYQWHLGSKESDPWMSQILIFRGPLVMHGIVVAITICHRSHCTICCWTWKSKEHMGLNFCFLNPSISLTKSFTLGRRCCGVAAILLRMGIKTSSLWAASLMTNLILESSPTLDSKILSRFTATFLTPADAFHSL